MAPVWRLYNHNANVQYRDDFYGFRRYFNCDSLKNKKKKINKLINSLTDLRLFPNEKLIREPRVEFSSIFLAAVQSIAGFSKIMNYIEYNGKPLLIFPGTTRQTKRMADQIRNSTKKLFCDHDFWMKSCSHTDTKHTRTHNSKTNAFRFAQNRQKSRIFYTCAILLNFWDIPAIRWSVSYCIIYFCQETVGMYTTVFPFAIRRMHRSISYRQTKINGTIFYRARTRSSTRIICMTINAKIDKRWKPIGRKT